MVTCYFRDKFAESILSSKSLSHTNSLLRALLKFIVCKEGCPGQKLLLSIDPSEDPVCSGDGVELELVVFLAEGDGGIGLVNLLAVRRWISNQVAGLLHGQHHQLPIEFYLSTKNNSLQITKYLFLSLTLPKEPVSPELHHKLQPEIFLLASPKLHFLETVPNSVRDALEVLHENCLFLANDRRVSSRKNLLLPDLESENLGRKSFLLLKQVLVLLLMVVLQSLQLFLFVPPLCL